MSLIELLTGKLLGNIILSERKVSSKNCLDRGTNSGAFNHSEKIKYQISNKLKFSKYVAIHC